MSRVDTSNNSQEVFTTNNGYNYTYMEGNENVTWTIHNSGLPAGEAFEVDAFNVTIDENGTELTNIENGPFGSNTDFYVFVVDTDNRTNKSSHGFSNLDLSLHAVGWNGSSFTSYGQFTALQTGNGSTGPTGPTGSSGSKGEKGQEGMTGSTGPKGEKGQKGMTGFTGPKGEKGQEGMTGSTGPKGEKGQKGMTGAIGPKGEKGQEGMTGDIGPKGEKGITGFTGSTGATGFTGQKGSKGDTGPKGQQGDNGANGVGTKGQKGEAGDSGSGGVESHWTQSTNDLYYTTGNVGIGTTSPEQKLHVAGHILLKETSNYYGKISGNNDNHSIWLRYSYDGTHNTSFYEFNDIRFFTGGEIQNQTERMRIKSDGNVGIGTTSPNQKLHIKGNDDQYAVLEFEGRRSSGIRKDRKAFIGVGATGGNYGTDMYFRIRNSADETVTWDTNSQNVLYMNGSTTHLYTGNTERMTINSSGNVGIGTTNPQSKLDVNGVVRAAYDQNSESVFGRVAIGYNHLSAGGGNTYDDWASFSHLDRNHSNGYALMHSAQGETKLNAANPYAIHFCSNDSKKISMTSNGYLGIGVDSPGYPLQIVGSSSVSAQGWNFRAIDEMEYRTRTFNTSIFCNQSIGTSAWIFTSSDSRIKKDIVEINDDTSLQKIRLLKPSTYKYRDPFTKGDFDTVDGFIAQEVKEVMPHATNTITECIPNIMLTGTSVSDVSNNYIITISTFDTSTLELDASGNIFPKLKTYINDDSGAEKEVYVTIKEIVSTTQIKVESEETIPSELYVYGQEVDNMHVLIKDKIFTTGISALQEVDRQQQADKAKIASLETQVADLLTRVSALENAN